MRRRTRVAVAGIAVAVVVLLALGALPSLLKSGDPYYLAATEVTPSGAPDDVAVVDASALPERRFPFTTDALDEGRSDRYWKGPVGLKGAFTHSPFDEFEALERRAPAASDGDAVLVRKNGTFYRVEVVHATG